MRSHPKITLVDVMAGIHALALYTKLTGAEWKFFMGLVLKSYELGFKNPIDVTNEQAYELGGGHSRQALAKTRERLAGQEFHGNWLFKYSPGDGWSKLASCYEINLKYLASQGKSWQGLTGSRSTERARDNRSRATPVVHPKIGSLDPDPLKILGSATGVARDRVEPHQNSPLADMDLAQQNGREISDLRNLLGKLYDYAPDREYEGKRYWECVDEYRVKINEVVGWNMARRGTEARDEMVWRMSFFKWDKVEAVIAEVMESGTEPMEQLEAIYKKVTGEVYEPG